MAWHKLLTARLVGKIKLVGPVVSCEGTPFKGNAASTWKDQSPRAVLHAGHGPGMHSECQSINF